MRRNCETVKLLLSIVGGVVFIYGFYTYNALYARCRRTEESNDKLQQLHESLSSQLQIIYEHKSRLEKTVQQEKLTHSKDRDEWEFDRDELTAKQKQLAGRLDSVNRDLGLLQGRYEELENDYSKLQDEHHKLTEDHRLLAEQHDDKYQQYKVDCENQVTKLKDQVLAQKRRVELCQAELNANDKRPPAAPQPVAPQQRHGAGDIDKVAQDVQRAGDAHMPALDRSALGVGDKPRANIPAYNAPIVEGPAVRPVRERKKSAVKASAAKLQQALPLANRGDEDGSVKLHRAGVVAQDADFDNGRQQAAAPHVDSVAGGGVVRGDSHIADKRIGDSEPEVNARPFAKNDQLMANGGRMGRLNSAAGRDVAAGGQGHHAGEEKDGDDGAVKDARDEHDDSLRPIGQHDGGDDGGDDLDDNQLAAAVPKPPPLNHPPAALRGQNDPVQDKNNKDDKAQYDEDYKDDDNKDH